MNNYELVEHLNNLGGYRIYIRQGEGSQILLRESFYNDVLFFHQGHFLLRFTSEETLTEFKKHIKQFTKCEVNKIYICNNKDFSLDSHFTSLGLNIQEYDINSQILKLEDQLEFYCRIKLESEGN